MQSALPTVHVRSHVACVCRVLDGALWTAVTSTVPWAAEDRVVNADDLLGGKFILLQRGKKNYFLVKAG